MKYVSLIGLLCCLSFGLMAQEVVPDTNYYLLPSQRRRTIQADPENNSERNVLTQQRNNSIYSSLPNTELNEIQTWNVALEGGFRNDVSLLSNSISGLIDNPSQLKPFWSILFGYTYRNAWALESGYARVPIHLNIHISNGSNPFNFEYQNSGHGIPLRIKRRIGSGLRAKNGTGFWISAGVWLIPNGNKQMDNFSLIGYNTHNRGSRTDTLRLTNNTITVNSFSGLGELGIDYTTRLSSFIEFGAYVRKFWGFGTALRSDISYTVNHTEEITSTITANGTGWGFGVMLRYIYGRRHDIKP